MATDLCSQYTYVTSASTVSRRRRALGIKASGANTKQLTEAQKRKLLMDELAKHPDGKRGPRSIKEAIAASTGQHLTRYDVSLLILFAVTRES